MNCEEVRTLFYERNGKGVAPSLVSQIDSHLKECESCRIELEDYQNIISLIKSLKEEDPGESFWEKQFQEIHHTIKLLKLEDQKKPSWILRVLTWQPSTPIFSMVTAAVVFFVALCFFAYNLFLPVTFDQNVGSGIKNNLPPITIYSGYFPISSVPLNESDNLNQYLSKLSPTELSLVIEEVLKKEQVSEEFFRELDFHQFESIYEIVSELGNKEMDIFWDQLTSYTSI